MALLLQIITTVNSKGQRAQGLHWLEKVLEVCCCPVLGDAGSPFYTSHSSELLCRPAVHLGNVNPFFCTCFVSVSHPYLAKREVFANCKHPLGRPTAEVSRTLQGEDEEHVWGPHSLPKRLLQMTNFVPSLCCVPGPSVLLLNPSPAAAAFKEENYCSSAFSNWK